VIGLDAALAEALDAGLTLVVPSPQRAAALRLAWTARQLAAGRQSWPSPQVLPWRIWLERELEAAAIASGYRWRTLQPLEESLLWRSAAAQAASEHALLQPALLAESVRHSLALSQEWSIPLTGDSDELRLARATIGNFRRRASALHAVTASDSEGWPAEFKPDTSRVRLVGFAELGEARRRWLAACGAQQIGSDELPAHEADPAAGGAAGAHAPAVSACADPEAELLAAARWARALLQQDPAARLLVVVPQLDSRRALAQHCFQTVLQPERLLATTGPGDAAAADEPLFALEGGVPLADYALVRAALQLLRLATSRLEFAEFSALLRSPYLAEPGLAQRLALDLWLRDNGVLEVDATTLATLAHRAPSGEPMVGEALRSWDALLQRLPATAALPARESAAAMARLLEAAGWPGPGSLGSEEQQTRNRCEELLGELARLGAAGGLQTAQASVDVLCAQARRQHFAPATADVPVTLTADCGDPIVQYDGIRVCGLSAAHWPRAVTPDPLLPVLAQRTAGVPTASAAGQLAAARRSLRHWARRGAVCEFSYARLEDDVEQRPSPLLGAERDASEPGVHAAAEPTGAPDLAAWLHAQRRGEWRQTEAGAAWSGGERLPGGTQLLAWQAACPYRAYAQLRLGALPLPEPTPGIDPRLRGQLLHAALEQLWRQLGSQAGLQALDATAVAARCEAAADAALGRAMARLPWPPGSALLARERTRIVRLLRMELEWEASRAPFSVERVEAGERPLRLADHELALRLDRVDRLEDGRRLILDYKSGRAERIDPEEERPVRPQLPAYAVALGDEVAAVATVHLLPERLQLRGLADGEARCGLTAAPRPWQEQLALWRGRLGRLVREFAAGEARVAPLKDACRHCHLDIGCRVDAGIERLHSEPAVDDDA